MSQHSPSDYVTFCIVIERHFACLYFSHKSMREGELEGVQMKSDDDFSSCFYCLGVLSIKNSRKNTKNNTNFTFKEIFK
jgi:hypothetical protein